jgi:hypothetical protein
MVLQYLGHGQSGILTLLASTSSECEGEVRFDLRDRLVEGAMVQMKPYARIESFCTGRYDCEE